MWPICASFCSSSCHSGFAMGCMEHVQGCDLGWLCPPAVTAHIFYSILPQWAAVLSALYRLSVFISSIKYFQHSSHFLNSAHPLRMLLCVLEIRHFHSLKCKREFIEKKKLFCYYDNWTNWFYDLIEELCEPILNHSNFIWERKHWINLWKSFYKTSTQFLLVEN